MNRKNYGYTLIEMIIVIAIMVILAGLSFISIGIIHQAKYNAAANTINNQMSNLWIQTKTVSQSVEQYSLTDPSATNKNKYPICMQIKKEGNDTYSLILGYDNGRGIDLADQEIVATLPNILHLEYVAKDSLQKYNVEVDSIDNKTLKNMIIEFNKSDGSVKYGAGTYNIIYDDKIVISIYLDSVTGKHYIK